MLPFGGAYVSLEAVHHILSLVHKNVGHQVTAASTVGLLASPFAQAPLLAASTLYPERGSGLHLVNRYSVVALGLFLLALMHVGWFRRGMVWCRSTAPPKGSTSSYHQVLMGAALSY